MEVKREDCKKKINALAGISLTNGHELCVFGDHSYFQIKPMSSHRVEKLATFRVFFR